MKNSVWLAIWAIVVCLNGFFIEENKEIWSIVNTIIVFILLSAHYITKAIEEVRVFSIDNVNIDSVKMDSENSNKEDSSKG